MTSPERADPEPPAVRFLLGPAGSGKTWRCLGEIRDELRRSPEGPALVFLAPKQATFQLERQLLGGGSLAGYTRLQILSFERLAEFVLDRLAPGPRECLDEEGRLMVLRALLTQRQGDLKVFRATARLPGFAQHLTLVLRELQRSQLGPVHLSALRQRTELGPALRDKLHDLALLLQAYLDWLKEQVLDDAHQRLDLAATALRDPPSGSPVSVPSAFNARPAALELGGLWLDGFAEMTPQETHLLAALVPHCHRATLAFCLDAEPREEPSWLSTWSVVGRTFSRLHARLAALPDCRVEVEVLRRGADLGRFAGTPALAHLEAHWTNPRAMPSESPRPAEAKASTADYPFPIQLVVCADPEAEAVFAAREIRRHVRETQGRFRDTAVMLRTLDGYHETLRRVFQRYDLPFFLDRRESVAHHPLAELTRFALRTVAFHWQLEDWMGALKTGLVPATDEEIDELENAALAQGWRGDVWHQTLDLPENPAAAQQLEPIRRRVIAPFQALARALAAARHEPTGAQLAQALNGLWIELAVAERLMEWTHQGISNLGFPTESSPHATVWEEMQSWLRNLERGFRSTALPLREWLAVVEAGLAGLTIGVVPPALDQVLIGTVDRSRHPDLKIAFVLGLNESVFPAPPPSGILLTETERADLERAGVSLGPSARQRLGHERYLGYIACTRAAERLVLTGSTRDAEGRPLNLSPFLAHLHRLFPQLPVESFTAGVDWVSAEHSSELLPRLIQDRQAGRSEALPASLLSWPGFARAIAKAEQVSAARRQTRLDPALATALHGRELRTSVTAIEDFAACPFRFFVLRGLRAEERQEFEVDPRERGRFQHAVLQEFHRGLQAEGRRWRDLAPEEARARIGQVGERLLPIFRNGLLTRSATARLNAQLLIEALQRMIAVLIGWMSQYDFDPTAVEVDFGMRDDSLPGWELDLGDGHRLVLRGRIDRVDLCLADRPGEALVVVIDYKSSERKLEATRLHHGLELQLLAYLNALAESGHDRPEFGRLKLIPAGAFYVNLRGAVASAGGRDDAMAEADAHRKAGYRHTGRFLADALDRFDNRRADKGDQFRYWKLKEGGFSERGTEALPAAAFAELLRRNEGFLRQHGQAIFAGEARVAPYRQGPDTACDLCPCRAICRFDPWIQGYRALTSPRPRPEDTPGKPQWKRRAA